MLVLQYRTVAKASLDLLLVFVSYQELPPDQDSPPAEGLRGSAYAFMQAVQSYSARNGAYICCCGEMGSHSCVLRDLTC